MAKRRRIPKSAKGLAIPKGGCRVVEGNIKICVSKSGIVSMAPSKRGPRKRKAGPKKRGRKPAARKRTTKRRKSAPAKCAGPVFKLRTRKGPKCACGVKGKKGNLIQRRLPEGDARCAGSPRILTWNDYLKELYTPGTTFRGVGRRKRRRSTRRRRRY